MARKPVTIATETALEIDPSMFPSDETGLVTPEVTDGASEFGPVVMTVAATKPTSVPSVQQRLSAQTIAEMARGRSSINQYTPVAD